MTPEGQLKQDCRKIAKKAGRWFYNIEGKGVNGIPDTIVPHTDDLGVVWIEFKRPGSKGVISDQQHKRAAELRAAGERVVFVTSVEEFKKAVGL